MGRTRLLRALVLVLVVGMTWVVQGGTGSIHRANQPIPGEYIVSLRAKGHTKETAIALAKQYKATLQEVWAGLDAFLMHGDREANAKAMSADPRVRLVEEDGAMALADASRSTYVDPECPSCTTPDDYLWYLDRIDQESPKLNGTYKYCSDGTGVVVYVVDQGVQRGHSEFAPGSVLDGYDATDENSAASPCGGFPSREVYESSFETQALRLGHGTSVASVIGGQNVGVARGATIIPVEITSCNPFSAAWKKRHPYRIRENGTSSYTGNRQLRCTKAGISGDIPPVNPGTSTAPIHDQADLSLPNHSAGTVEWVALPPPAQDTKTSLMLAGINWIVDIDVPYRFTSQNKPVKAVANFSAFASMLTKIDPDTGKRPVEPPNSNCSNLDFDTDVSSIESEILKLTDKGVAVVASANNQNFPACSTVPGEYSDHSPMITVGGSMLLND